MKIRLAKQVYFNTAYRVCSYCEHTSSNDILADGLTDWEECSEEEFKLIKQMVNFHNTNEYYRQGFYYVVFILVESNNMNSSKPTIDSFMKEGQKRFAAELERSKKREEQQRVAAEARKRRKLEQEKQKFEALKKKFEGATNEHTGV